MENTLHNAMDKQERAKPIPFSVHDLTKKKEKSEKTSTLLVTRKSVLSRVLLGFRCSFRQITLSNKENPEQPS